MLFQRLIKGKHPLLPQQREVDVHWALLETEKGMYFQVIELFHVPTYKYESIYKIERIHNKSILRKLYIYIYI